MAKKAATKKVKEEALDDILFNCRNSLRGRAALSDKRDMVLTLVFLKFISERYHDRCKEVREENADDPEYAEMLISQKRTAFGEKGVFMLTPETDWEAFKLTAPNLLAVTLDDAATKLMESEPKLKNALPSALFVNSGTEGNVIKEFKDERSNFRIVIVVDMWITGFDVPSLNMLFNDKPLQKHTLIQTISRVSRKFSNVVLDEDGNRISGDIKKNGIIIDYLGIHSNLQQAMKKYGGDETGDIGDVNLALEAFKNELKILKQITHGFDFSTFFGDNPLARLKCLQGAVEFLLMEEAKGVEYEGNVKPTTAFKSHVKRLKAAYNICNPACVLSDDEVAWAQLLMGVYSYLVKITDSHHDVESMNRHVEQMVKEAISCSSVEIIFDMKGEIDIYGEDFLKELDDVKLPCSKFELLVKLLRKAIKEYKKTNITRAEHFYKLLQATIEEYHNRDSLTYVNQVTGSAVNSTVDMVEDRIKALTDQLKTLFGELQADKMEFKKLGISFQDKAFYDILIEVRDNANPPFDYPDDKCIELAKRIKELVDDSSLYADWLNNSKVRDRLANQLTKLFWKNGYPPEWDNVVFDKILEQVENFKENSYSQPLGYDYQYSDITSIAAEP